MGFEKIRLVLYKARRLRGIRNLYFSYELCAAGTPKCIHEGETSDGMMLCIEPYCQCRHVRDVVTFDVKIRSKRLTECLS